MTSRYDVKIICSETSLLGFEHFNVIAVVYKSCGEKKRASYVRLNYRFVN